MSLPRILVIKTGSTHPEVIRLHGDYDRWFARALERGDERVHAASGQGELPSPRPFGGVILTGSPSSVRDETPWMATLSRWALEADEAGIPVLAVCFGHQLLGEALGGRVERMPSGPERGTTEIELTEAGAGDPLFEGLPPRLLVYQTHEDELALPPPAAVRLAGNPQSRWQAFRAGRCLRAVQFHPEVDAETLARLLAVRGQARPVPPSAHGAAILRNWDERLVRKPPD